MWLQSERGVVALAHVAELYVDTDRGAGPWLVAEMASGIIKPIEGGWASVGDAHSAVRAVLDLARLADQGLWGRTGDVISPKQALARQQRLAEQDSRQPSPSTTSPAPEGASSFPPTPLTDAEVERADRVLAGAAEHARTINEGAAAAARGDGDPVAGGRVLR